MSLMICVLSPGASWVSNLLLAIVCIISPYRLMSSAHSPLGGYTLLRLFPYLSCIAEAEGKSLA